MMPVATKKQLSVGDEILGGQNLVVVVAGVEGTLPLVVVRGPETTLDHAAEDLIDAGRDDAFGGAPDDEEEVDSGGLAGCRDGRPRRRSGD